MANTEAPRPFEGYLPTTPEDRAHMLQTIGVGSVAELFPDIPHILLDPPLNLERPLSEMELMAKMKELAGKNRVLPSFLGYGVYRRFQPSIIGSITGRNEFLTSYTPYQPEISQGTLLTAFEFQSMMCNLYGMEVSNTGMYDGGSSLAEAALMATRVQEQILRNPDRNKIVVLDTVHPNSIDNAKAYMTGKDSELVVKGVDEAIEELDDAAALIIQTPNYLGNLEEAQELGEIAHSRGALFVVSADPVSLGILAAPGDYGADIVIGEGQSLGNSMSLGGVNLGIFASKERFVRQMPGRIAGQTKEINGDKTGYALTLVAREQFTRRAKATSNICTAEQLVALGSTIYVAAYGAKGMRELAEHNYQNAHHLARQISSIPGYSLAFPERHFFNEFVAQCPEEPVEINRRLLDAGIIGGKDVSGIVPKGMLLCATETTTVEQIDQLVSVLSH